MKSLFVFFLVLFLFTGAAFASPQQDFLQTMVPLAQEVLPGYGLFPSVFLAQAALESGWGRSWLAQNANNFFGRKCLEEPCVEVWTPEYRNGVKTIELLPFQMYLTPHSAVEGYCKQFFRKWKNGEYVYKINLSSPEAFIRSIVPPYATDPKYIEKVLRIIYQYDLKRYDPVRNL